MLTRVDPPAPNMHVTKYTHSANLVCSHVWILHTNNTTNQVIRTEVFIINGHTSYIIVHTVLIINVHVELYTGLPYCNTCSIDY